MVLPTARPASPPPSTRSPANRNSTFFITMRIAFIAATSVLCADSCSCGRPANRQKKKIASRKPLDDARPYTHRQWNQPFTAPGQFIDLAIFAFGSPQKCMKNGQTHDEKGPFRAEIVQKIRPARAFHARSSIFPTVPSLLPPAGRGCHSNGHREISVIHSIRICGEAICGEAARGRARISRVIPCTNSNPSPRSAS